MATVVPMPPPEALKSVEAPAVVAKRSAASAQFVDLTRLPPEVQTALATLDADKSGSLDISEIYAAVQALRSSRETNRRLVNLLLGLVVLIALLLASLLGVSYAAAVLAQTTKSGNGSLQDTNGNTLRTAGSAIVAGNANFQINGAGGRRLSSSGSTAIPDHFYAYRRKPSTGGRKVMAEEQFHPAPLVLVASTKGHVAKEVCKFAHDGHFNVVLPKFDPYEDEVQDPMTHFKPGTIAGCSDLSAPHGFTADFSAKLDHSSPHEPLFHIDCPGPVHTDSNCNIYRAFLVSLPPDVVTNVDVSVARNDTTWTVNGSGDLVPANGNSVVGGRRLGSAVGDWPPPKTLGLDVSEDKCPTLYYTTSFTFSRSNIGRDNETAWKTRILNNNLDLTESATPASHAKIFSQTSVNALIGFTKGIKTIFDKQFWNGASSAALAISKYIAVDKLGVMSLTTVESAFSMFKNNYVPKCTTAYKRAVCSKMNTVLVMTGLNTYTCKLWNVNDYLAGGIEISQSCANACQMLQWYSAWWRRYRVGLVVNPALGVPSSYDGTNYQFTQDFCGSTTIVNNSPSYYSGQKENNPVTDVDLPYTTHPSCWPGFKIPLCRSWHMVSDSTC